MIELTEREYIEHLQRGGSFTLLREGKEYELSCQMYLTFDEENLEDSRNGQITYGAYQLVLDGEEILETEDFSEVYAFFQTQRLPVVKINERFSSMEEFYENQAFNEADMQTLLEKYADCDSFSLSAYVYDEAFALTPAEKEEILQAERREFERLAAELYERVPSEYALPPLEEVLADIWEECLQYERKKVKRGKKNFYACSMICDEVGKSTRYAEPAELFWHLYHESGRLLDCEREVNNAPVRVLPRGAEELEGKEYAPLQPFLLRVELTYTTHCTKGGLQKVLYFSLNEQTREWLSAKKNDYDFSGSLQDLAFYKGGKLRFSSCTHEGYHDDIKEEV